MKKIWKKEKQVLLVLSLIVICLSLIFSCNPPNQTETESKSVKVGLIASIKNNTTSQLSYLSNSFIMQSGNSLSTISTYKVVFKKVEIGNTEGDKFTLWENVSGEEKDVINEINFNSSCQIKTGSYKYVRLTIDKVLKISGSHNENGTMYTGSGICNLDNSIFIWGTDITNFDGEITLQNPISITTDCNLFFSFDIANTIHYANGPQENAVFNVAKPVMNVNVVNY